MRHRDSALHATLPASYVSAHVELGYASTVHIAQGLTADVMHGIVTGEESRQTLYTMLTRGRVENHVHVVLASEESGHALPSPVLSREATVIELLGGIVACNGAASSALSVRAVAASPEAQLQDAVARYADGVALAASRLRVSLGEAPAGPLPWLVGVPSEVAASGWDAYLAARARRVTSLVHPCRSRRRCPSGRRGTTTSSTTTCAASSRSGAPPAASSPTTDR